VFTYLIGRTDAVGKQYVGTRFFAFVGPILPLKTMFIVSESFQQSGRSSTHSYQGVGLKLYWKSVLLGYLRVWTPILALAWPFLTMWGQAVRFEWKQEWIVPLVLLAAWIPMLIFPGRLSAAKQAQLKVIAEHAGLAVDPRRLGRFERDNTTEDLAERLKARNLPIDPQGTRRAAAGASREDVGLMYAHARYVGDEEWRNVAEELWVKLAIR
jgi:hypothetical protein